MLSGSPMGRHPEIDRPAALDALWGSTSTQAAALLGCSPSALRHILQQQPDEVREAYRVARLAAAIRSGSTCPTVRALAETLLTVAATARRSSAG
jgi:hypothetical protein